MKVYEYGRENAEVFVMFPCTAEPWWVFAPSAEKLAEEYHVFLIVADGHDEQGTDFVSIEKYAHDAADYLRQEGIEKIDAMYGVSMGGACTLRFLAAENIPVDKAVIDAGITPYPYPKPVCRLIAAADWTSVMLATRSMRIMKLAALPERWTPAGEDSEEHYERIFEFEKKHYSPKTIYNVFWSANNYSMPEPVPKIRTKIEYWYGEKEERARKNNCAYTCRIYPQTAVRKFDGMEHAELVMMHPERFRTEVIRFLKEEENR